MAIKAELKSSELMLGNKVKYADCYQTIYEVRRHSVITEEVVGEIKTTDLQGILLSESVLLKCGFEKAHSTHDDYSMFSIFIDDQIFYLENRVAPTKENIWTFMVKNDSDYISLAYYNYLHEVQNCIHSLTVQHLTFKP